MWVGGAAALGAILMCDETITVEATTAITLVVVEQEEPSGGAGIDHDVAFEAVPRIPGDQLQRR